MFTQYVTKNGKALRCGFTTGSCATAASKAAAQMLLSGQTVTRVPLKTPNGTALEIEISNITQTPDSVTCAVRKDSGDDPDITAGMLLFATVRKTNLAGTITIDGGVGIGRVTKPGLNQPVGNAAINSVPRQMITENLEDVCNAFAYDGGLDVLIFAPEGETLAKKTFNARLGIIGGLSVLGTSGIVEPMSEDAIIDTIYVQIDVRYAAGNRILLLTPGNYGQDFINAQYKINSDIAIKCSNYIGKAIDYAYAKGFEGILVIGHAGKILKLGCGLFNTHSKYGDCRAELIATCSALYGAPPETIAEIMQAVSSDEMLAAAEKQINIAPVLAKITERILFHLSARMYGERTVGVIFFTDTRGLLGQSDNADAMLAELATF